MTIQTDTQLEKEFRTTTKLLKSRYSTFNSNKLPSPFSMPDLAKYVFIKGIEEPNFSKLNNNYAKLYEEKTFNRRQYWNDGTIRKEREHKPYTDCVIIESPISLGLTKDVIIRDKDYKYIDYREDENGKKKFYYEVPKTVCFSANMCALVVSDNKRAKHLGGEKILLKNGHTVYLYILPIKNAKLSEGYKVLSIKPSNEFVKEIKILKKSWRQQGIMYKNPSLFNVETRNNGIYNLVSEIQDTDIEISKYEQVSLAKEVLTHESY